MKAQRLNQKQTRWPLYLSRFDFALKHVSGKSMRQADSLSRKADWVKGVELIKEVEEEIIEKIKKSKAKNNEIVKAVDKMKRLELRYWEIRSTRLRTS